MSKTKRKYFNKIYASLQDTEGESILICANNNAKVGQELIGATLKPITSCLSSDNHVSF